jgi:hypothetical protein
MSRRITRADYEAIKAQCAAHIKLRMEQLDLTPSAVEKRSADAVFKQQQPAYVTMQELAAWRGARQLPKDLKLKALAAVLDTHPDKLVPKEHQHGRSLVSRHVKASLDEKNGGFRLSVTPSEAQPGHAYVEARILLPLERAYAFGKALSRTNSVEVMRRVGMSEEQIKETLDGDGAMPQV